MKSVNRQFLVGLEGVENLFERYKTQGGPDKIICLDRALGCVFKLELLCV